MSELKALRLKEKILLIELDSIRKQIAVYDEDLTATTVQSVQEDESLKTDKKVEIKPCSTSKNDKASLLHKDDISSDEQSSPSPVANGTGKDSTNPLKAINLPKVEEVIRLRPSYANVTKAPAVDNSRWYVIFEGEHKGIYDNWAVVSKYVTGSKVAFKKYSNLLQARREADKYSTMNGGQIPIKGLSPEPIQGQQRRRTIFQTTQVKEEVPTIEDEFPGISFEGFQSLWSKARNASMADYEHEKFYTDDKATRSLFVFCPEADESLVYLAFRAGLVKCIYPSKNLQEIKSFPKGFKEAVKKFRTKIAASKDANIYIQVTSTLPEWGQGIEYPAYHFVEVGLAKQRPVEPSKAMEEGQDYFHKGLHERRAEGFMQILQKTQKIQPDQLFKLNYSNRYCVIISNSGNPLSKAENKSLKDFEDKILDNEIMAGPTTKGLLCKKLKKTTQAHSCNACEKDKTSTSTASNDSSSTKEDKDD